MRIVAPGFFRNSRNFATFPWSDPDVHRLYSGDGFQSAKNPAEVRFVALKDEPMVLSGTATMTFFTP